MKRITQLFTAVIFLSLIFSVACKKKTSEDPDPLDIQGQKLMSATWGPASPGDVTKDGNENGDWSNFKITFDYNTESNIGQYTVTGLPANDGVEDVFGVAEGGSQAWTFENGTNTGVLVRQDDNIRMEINVEEATSLTISFLVPTSSGRVAGFDGEWLFTLVAQ